MSFLNTLVNIGSTIGKVAIDLFGGKSIVNDDGVEYKIGLCRLADISFVLRKENQRTDIYMCNTNPVIDYVVTFPGENGEKGEIVWLKHLSEEVVTDWFNENNNPHRKLYVSSRSEDTAGSNRDANTPSMMNLSFNRLKINGAPVKLGGFDISVAGRAGEKGIKIECEHAMGLQNLRTCTLISENGISLRSSDYIAPQHSANDSEETQFYPLDYTQHGLRDGDYISGVINVEIKDSNILSANCIVSHKILTADIRDIIMHHV